MNEEGTPSLVWKPGPIIILAQQQVRSLAKPCFAVHPGEREVWWKPWAGSGTSVRQPGYPLLMQSSLFHSFPPSTIPHHHLHQMSYWSLQITCCDPNPCPLLPELITFLFLSSQHGQRLAQKSNISFRFCFLNECIENRGINSPVMSRGGRTLQGKWISRLYGIKSRKSKESMNVDLCYLLSAQNLLDMRPTLRPVLNLSPCLRLTSSPCLR